MKQIKTAILAIKNASEHAIKNAQDIQALELARVEFLGRKGKIAALMPQLKDLSVEEKERLALF